MTILGWPIDDRIAGGVAMLLSIAALVVAVRTGKAGLGAVTYDRAIAPVAYWGMVAMIVALGLAGAAGVFNAQG
jgi:hypothetical protein